MIGKAMIRDGEWEGVVVLDYFISNMVVLNMLPPKFRRTRLIYLMISE